MKKTLNVRTCENCGYTKGIVYDSRMRPDGTIKRRRGCPKCKMRWTTVEVRGDYR